MATLTKWWPSILTVLVAIVTALTPSVQAFAAAHVQFSAAILAVWGVVLHALQSPVAPTTPKP